MHLVQHPPAIPPAFADSAGNDFNAGRVQSIAVSPVERDRALVAMEFGGLWGTVNGGGSWFRIFSLPTVMATDVEFGGNGTTVVATVFRDNRTVNGGGIYVSQDRGGTWTRPPTGVVPPASMRTSAYSVSRAPDEEGLWYVATDFGVAISRDSGATWSHERIDRSPQMAQSVLAFPGGTVLALGKSALYRSNNRGKTWRKVMDDDFTFFSPLRDMPGYSGNKMDRSPYAPWAFILKEYHYGSNPSNRGGTIWFYELDTDSKTLLMTPQGTSRGPFVRVSKDLEADKRSGPGHIKIWTGHGWDGYQVTRKDAAEFRALTPADWVSYIATSGIHSDMGDLGVDGDLQPVFLGSDGGIFKPRPASSSATGDWMSAAAPGSGMNSLQITDLAGTNVLRPNRQVVSTSLYFGTQDNYIWASPDGGATWPRHDASEGYDLEVRPDALLGHSITVGYVEIGSDWTEQFAGANLFNQRAVPDVDQNGQPLNRDEMKQAFYLELSPGGVDSTWLRLRTPPEPTSEIFVSRNSGNNWRKRFTVNFLWAGSVQRTNLNSGLLTQGVSARLDPDVVTGGIREGVMAWVAVYAGGWVGGFGTRIGLVPLSNLYADRVDTFDDSDVVLLPGSGSLGLRAAQWDSHTVFGVDPYDWRFLIAPDVVAGDVKVSHDGGQSWAIDQRLTYQVLRGGGLKMRDGDDYHMQVTKIAFDPYRNGRILVGTRDAGVICTIDDGKTWRTIRDSDRISYVTGFHFYPNGAVHIASWGHGLWFLKATTGCSKTYGLRWDGLPPVADTTGTVGTIARATSEPPAPRGIANPSQPKLFLATSAPSSGIVAVGPDNLLRVSGRSFPAGQEVQLIVRGSELPKQVLRVDKSGQFSTTVKLPEDLPYGSFTIEAVLGSTDEILTAANFVKSYSDEGKKERDQRR